MESAPTSKPRRSSKPGSLEALPLELKLMVVRCLPNELALRTLTLASPIYRILQENYDEVLTAVTVNQLNERGFDSFGPHNIMQVRLQDNVQADRRFRIALRAFWNECQTQKISRKPKLPAAVCGQVLRITSVVGWVIATTQDDLPSRNGFLTTPISFDEGWSAKWYGWGQSPQWTGYLTRHSSFSMDFLGSSVVFLDRWCIRYPSTEQAVIEAIRDLTVNR